MISATDVSVVVITKDRKYDLERLVQSFCFLTELPKEILIITRSSDTNAEQVIVDKNRQLNIRLVYQQSNGYAGARNLGVIHSLGQVIAFVDDDCVVPPSWIKEIVAAHNRFGPIKAVMGMTLSTPVNNFYAAIAQLHYQNWVNSVCHNGQCGTLDAKITSFNRKIFLKHDLWFDEAFSGGSEDVELGYRLHRKGIKIYCEPKIFFSHHERTALMPTLKQRWRNAKGEALLRRYVNNHDVGMIPLTRTLSLPALVRKQLVLWAKERKYLWCLKYVLILPVFFVVRLVGYWWGWLLLRNRERV